MLFRNAVLNNSDYVGPRKLSKVL